MGGLSTVLAGSFLLSKLVNKSKVSMKYKKYLALVAIVLIGVPFVSFGSSFTYSLIQGKTPSEALNIIADQIDYLTGRVDELENQQQSQENEIESLKEENAILQEKIENNTQSEPEKPVEDASCNRFREEIKKLKVDANIEIDALEEEMRTLKEERKEAQQEARDNKPDFDDASDEMEWMKNNLDSDDEYSERIDEIEEQIDGLEDELKSKLKPVIEQADDAGCLLG
jgi:chromosome segregation ATPase